MLHRFPAFLVTNCMQLLILDAFLIIFGGLVQILSKFTWNSCSPGHHLSFLQILPLRTLMVLKNLRCACEDICSFIGSSWMDHNYCC